MSSDRFVSGVQLPNIGTGITVRASDSSDYRRTFYKLGKLYYTDETGAETQMTGRVATTTTLGEVIVDGTTITVDGSGNISALFNPLNLQVSGVTVAQIEATGTTTNSQIIFKNYQDSVLSTAFSIDAAGELTASSFAGSGANLTNISYTVTQNDVTQHQGALSITISQISDFGTYIEDANLQLFVDAFSLPTTDGSSGQVLTTNGLGTLSFQTPVASGISNVVEDTTPQLGGNLDLNSNDITGTGNVSITGSLSSSFLDLSTAAGNPAHAEGRIFYDEVAKAVAVYNEEADVTLQVGQEQWVRVYNNTGSTVSNGAPVYLVGEIGGIPTIALASALTVSTASAVGLATHDIEAATFGYATVQGIVFGVNTSGLTQGARVHVSPTAGVLQSSAPSYPYYPTDIGICLISDSVNGCIYVNPIQHHAESFRTSGDVSFDGDVRIGGNLTILGTQSIISATNLSVSDNIIYLNGGNAIGAENTTFTGTGLNDAFFTGYYEGNDAGTTYYVRIDGVGTGTGGVDTFEWSTDNFSTTVATAVDITGEDQALSKNIKILFNATTGHTSGDQWSGTALPSNIDIGFMGNRNTGASGIGYTHVGFFYDTADNKFKAFKEYGPDPVAGNINASDPTFVLGDVDFNNITCNDITGTTFSGVSASATGLTTARDFSITGAITASAQSFNGTADVTFTATLNSDIADLNDVSATAPTDGQVLTYNNTAGLWQPADPSGGGGAFLPTKLDSITTVNGQETYALTNLSNPYTPSTVNALLVSLNGVTQSPGDAFTLSGSNITFIPALQTGDVVDFIIDLGAAVDVISTTEVDTLNSVTTRGSATTNDISVGGLTATSVTSSGSYTEQTYIITGTTPVLDPSNGTIQTWDLTGNSTPTENLTSGQFITLHISDGTAYTITWPTIVWLGSTAPNLDTLGLTVIQLWKIGTTLYGAEIGVLL